MKNVSVKKMNGKGKNAFRAVLIVVALIFATCFALAACATGEEVQIEKVTSASEINRLIAKANFTAENAVRDKMEGRFGTLSDYSYNNGRATADIEKDGKSYSVTVEIEVDESDFSVTRYKNATRSGDSLIYTLNGEEVTYSVSDKIIVEENGYFYVIDVSGARAEIDRAVSAAILTEKGGSQEETPDTQIEPIKDINVIEQLLNQKDLSIEALAKAAATTFYGQKNVSNLSYQNSIVSGQAKTAEGTVNFSANLDLSATDFEGKFYVGTKLGADGKTLTFYQNGTLTTLTITQDLAAIETADGVYVLDTVGAQGVISGKFTANNSEVKQITFDSWQKLMSAGGEPLKESINSIFQDTLFTDTIIKRMFGNDMTMSNLNDGTIEILKWAFHIDGENITSVEVMGNRIGYPREVSRWLQTATFTFNTPINLSSIAVSGVENPDISNSVSNIQDGITYYFDLQEFSEKCANSTYTAGFRHTVNDETLDETNQAYFDLCMRLAVEAGLIDSNTNLSFVSGQMTSGSNSAWGSTYEVPVKAIDLNTNTYYEITGIFDNNMDTSMTALERMVDAIDRGEFRLNGGAKSKIISGDIIYEFEDALDGIVKYTIPAENQK